MAARLQQTGTLPEETVQLGLRTLALCGGNASRAAKLLQDADLEHPPAKRTLQDWKDKTYANRYLEILNETQRDIASRTADTAMELAGRAQSVSAELVEVTAEKKDQIEPKDLARSALALTQVSAEQVRTGRLLREQPTSISEVREPSEIIEELKALHVAESKKRSEAIDVEVLDPVAK